MNNSVVVQKPRRKRKTATGSTTLRDVARKIGVSPMTVSRALNQPEMVSEETRNTVQQAILEMGYVPNAVAGALASNRSKLVSVLLPTMANPIFSGYVQALMDGLAVAGYQVLLGLTNYRDESEEELLATVISRRPDAIVLTGTQHSPASRRLLKAANIPIVETWDLTQEPLDLVVGFSHYEVGCASARHLIDLQYRRFGLLWLDDVRGGLRLQGFIDTLAQHGIQPASVHKVAAPASQQSGREGLVELLEEAPDLDVIVCSSDELAFGVLTETQVRGVRVPEDIGLMGYGDFAAAAYTHPALTTVKVNSEAIGRETAAVLLTRLDVQASEIRPAPVTDTGFLIIGRESTRERRGH